MKSKERGMFRVYQCRNCKYIGWASVSSEEERSTCALCMAPIVHQPGMQYASTLNQADELVMDLAIQYDLRRTERKPQRGLGVKRRVFNIVQALIEMNRGRPATLHEVMEECELAGIDPERAEHFLTVLQNEGALDITSERITIGGFAYDYE